MLFYLYFSGLQREKDGLSPLEEGIETIIVSTRRDPDKLDSLYAEGHLSPPPGYWIGWCGCDIRDELELLVLDRNNSLQEALTYYTNYPYSRNHRFEILFLGNGNTILKQKKIGLALKILF